MASLPTTITFTHTPTELHVNPADYTRMISAYAEQYPGEMFPVPFVADPDVPQGTIWGVGLGSFTDDLGNKTERQVRVTYKTGVGEIAK